IPHGDYRWVGASSPGPRRGSNELFEERQQRAGAQNLDLNGGCSAAGPQSVHCCMWGSGVGDGALLETGSLTERRQPMRVLLGACAAVYLVIYLWVSFIAMVPLGGLNLFTGHSTTFLMFLAWYMFLAPVAYAVFCLLYAIALVSPRLPRAVLV